MLIYRLESVNKALRIAIQYIIFMFASAVCLFVPMGITGSKMVIGLTLTTVIYFSILGVCVFFSHMFKKNKGKEEVYTSKFRKSK